MIKLTLLLEETISKEELTLNYLKNILRGTEFDGKVYLAGGAVRDQIMGNAVKDIDVVVAMPDGGIKFANWITRRVGAYKEGANPVVFPRFGTAKFNLRGAKQDGIDLSGVDIESVMTRGEKYTSGSRKPEVVYSDLKADVERRDLTVNSLLRDLVTGEIKDLTGNGLADIKNGIIRTPLDPNITFSDDPLRMMRAVRFAVKYNWKMVPDIIDAMKQNADKLKNISSERIQDELNKILMTDNPDMGMKILTATGLNKYIIPELDACLGVGQNEYHTEDVYDHILTVVKNSPKDLKMRLAALFHDIGKPLVKTTDSDGKVHFYEHEHVGAELANTIMQRLKYPNEMIKSVVHAVDVHMDLKQSGKNGEIISDKSIRRFVSNAGDDLQTILGLMQADNISHSDKASMPNQIPEIIKRMDALQTAPTKPVLPVNGHDLMTAFNLKPGPIIKNLLSAIENAWFENPKMTRDDALQIAKAVYMHNHSPTDQRKKLEGLLYKKIRNPKTNNDILVKTALSYDKTHPAYIAAKNFIKINL